MKIFFITGNLRPAHMQSRLANSNLTCLYKSLFFVVLLMRILISPSWMVTNGRCSENISLV